MQLINFLWHIMNLQNNNFFFGKKKYICKNEYEIKIYMYIHTSIYISLLPISLFAIIKKINYNYFFPIFDLIFWIWLIVNLNSKFI